MNSARNSLKIIGCLILALLFSQSAFSHETNNKQGTEDMKTVGHKLIGKGKEKVLVMHSWFSDCTSYEPMLPYLNTEKFTYLFMDLRGYGLSKELPGEYTVEEASLDAITLVNSLSWDQFHIVGHSMSGMIAQKIAVDHASRVKSVVAITPVPASGSPSPAEITAFLQSAALDDDDNAIECIHLLTARRLTPFIAKKIVDYWRNCSNAEARLAYLNMFSNTDFSESAKGLKTPILVIYAEYDFEGVDAVLREKFLSLYPNAKMECCKGSGHFPPRKRPFT